MKKLGLLVKEISEDRIKNSLKESDSVFVINYSKISSSDLSALRQSLKSSKAGLLVVKNTVARRALKEAGLEELIKSIDGPCGLVFAKEEPVLVSRLLYDFYKSHEPLKLQGGALKNRIMSKDDIEVLAKLPSQEILRTQVAMTLNSPIKQFVFVLNQILTKFVYCLDQIATTKTADKNPAEVTDKSSA